VEREKAEGDDVDCVDVDEMTEALGSAPDLPADSSSGAPTRPERRIVLAYGDLGASTTLCIRGNSMPTKRLMRTLILGKYVSYTRHVGEHNTSKVCNSCYHQGRTTLTEAQETDGGKQWKLRRCPAPGCVQYWNRDVMAALNIRSIFLFAWDDPDRRPACFSPARRNNQ
jgi:hypothetical protein